MCDCGCNDCGGLGAIPAIEAQSLNNYVLAGSVIEWGGYTPTGKGKIDSNAQWNDRQEGVVKDSLWQSGGFSMVDAGKVAGFWNEYISIRVTTRVDFSRLADVLGLIEHAIYAAGLQPDAQHFWVVSAPANAANKPNVAKPNAGVVDPSAPTSGFDPCKYLNLPYLCYTPVPTAVADDEEENFIDQVAGWLGVKPSEAALIGVVGAVVGIVALKRLL